MTTALLVHLPADASLSVLLAAAIRTRGMDTVRAATGLSIFGTIAATLGFREFTLPEVYNLAELTGNSVEAVLSLHPALSASH
jgi:hypothetical protein